MPKYWKADTNFNNPNRWSRIENIKASTFTVELKPFILYILKYELLQCDFIIKNSRIQRDKQKTCTNSFSDAHYFSRSREPATASELKARQSDNIRFHLWNRILRIGQSSSWSRSRHSEVMIFFNSYPLQCQKEATMWIPLRLQCENCKFYHDIYKIPKIMTWHIYTFHIADNVNK